MNQIKNIPIFNEKDKSAYRFINKLFSCDQSKATMTGDIAVKQNIILKHTYLHTSYTIFHNFI